MSEFQREIVLTVGDRKYKLTVPTVGQLIAIETLKSQLTQGNYGNLVKSATSGAELSLDIVDAIATITILCPDYLKDLKVDSIMELDIFDFKQTMQSFRKDVYEWMNECHSMLRAGEDKEDKTK